MTREDIIRMAEECGIPEFENNESQADNIIRFAALVAAAERNSWPAEMEAMERQVNILTDALAQAKAEEREACAKVCEELDIDGWRDAGWDMGTIDCAAAIRARGQA